MASSEILCRRPDDDLVDFYFKPVVGLPFICRLKDARAGNEVSEIKAA
jgi:hypothetical protein